LYSDTRGAAAVIVISTDEMREGGAAAGPFREFTKRLYPKLGLTAPEIERGLLVFVSKNDQRAAVQMGDRWPYELRARVEKLFRDTAIAGFSHEQAARGISEFVKTLDRLIRESLSSR
jgi:uncharacterized membrane protein YgcG